VERGKKDRGCIIIIHKMRSLTERALFKKEDQFIIVLTEGRLFTCPVENSIIYLEFVFDSQSESTVSAMIPLMKLFDKDCVNL
jgi:hypothetical protein